MSLRATTPTQIKSANRQTTPPASPAVTTVSPVPNTSVMSDDTRSQYAGVPKLTKDNYADWAMQVEAYLTGAADHWRVLEENEAADGTITPPTAPTDRTTAEYKDWRKSE